MINLSTIATCKPSITHCTVSGIVRVQINLNLPFVSNLLSLVMRSSKVLDLLPSGDA